MLVLYCCVQNSNSFDSTQSEVRKGPGSFTFIAVTHRTGWLQTSTFSVDRVTQRWSKPVAFLSLHLDGTVNYLLCYSFQFSILYIYKTHCRGEKQRLYAAMFACSQSLMAFNVTLSIQYSSFIQSLSTNPSTLLTSICSTKYLWLQQWIPNGYRLDKFPEKLCDLKV